MEEYGALWGRECKRGEGVLDDSFLDGVDAVPEAKGMTLWATFRVSQLYLPNLWRLPSHHLLDSWLP